MYDPPPKIAITIAIAPSKVQAPACQRRLSGQGSGHSVDMSGSAKASSPIAGHAVCSPRDAPQCQATRPRLATATQYPPTASAVGLGRRNAPMAAATEIARTIANAT